MTALAARLPPAFRAYLEPAPLAALLLGISSAFPYTMIGATLTTRLAQDGISKKSVAMFALAFLVYNLKFLWAPLVDSLRLPGLHRLGQRRAWLTFSALWCMASVWVLGALDPKADLALFALAAVMMGVAGATFDIVIDAYRIELLTPEQLGAGAGMSQYGWRIGSVCAAGLALLVAEQANWSLAYSVCAVFALPALLAAAWQGEPPRRRASEQRIGIVQAVVEPLAEFLRRHGAWLILLFVLLHKIGDTLANLTLRLLLNDLQFTNTEIATYDVGLGVVAYLVGIFAGGLLYARFGMARAVLVSLVLMAVSNLMFAVLAAAGHSVLLLGVTIGFENFASGIGGVAVVAYLSALCNLNFTATQYALLSAAASVLGRFLTGTTAGSLIESYGFVNFYLFTTLVALPGVFLFAWMWRAGFTGTSAH